MPSADGSKNKRQAVRQKGHTMNTTKNTNKTVTVADIKNFLGDSTQVCIFQFDERGYDEIICWCDNIDIKDEFLSREVEAIYPVDCDCIRILVAAE